MTEIHALTPPDEIARRINKIRAAMADVGLDAVLISSNANIYYATGRVFSGFVYIPAEGEPLYFVRRPVGLTGVGVHYIHKVEQIAPMLADMGMPVAERLGLELGVTDYLTVGRLSKAFPDCVVADASIALRKARSVKTPYEISLLRRSGIKQAEVYRRIPSFYREGMSDVELQIEIERELRLEGCLGQFRISGDSMELFMCNLLVGNNADVPTPYDFAMGGEGLDPSLPVGANGTIITRGMTVMVDANGNFTGYMTDMTRVFSVGDIDELASKAHECSVRICRELASMGRPGVAAKDLYECAVAIVAEARLENYFMGHTQKAGFVGHGVGIEINEMPVIAPRSRDVLAEGNVVAIEPKFVIPHVGAVGIENTYVVTSDAMERITNAPEEIISFD